MKRIAVLNILVLVVSLSSFKVVNAQDIVKYKRVRGSFYNYDFLLINYGDSSYKYSYVANNVDFGEGDIIMQGGTFKRKGDTLILNSENKPNNYDLIKVEELVVPNADSVEINIKLGDEGSPRMIYINNNVRYGNVEDWKNLKMKIPKQSIKSILLVLLNSCHSSICYTYHPIYYTKNPNANLFNISIQYSKETEKDNFIWPSSVFFDKKLLLKGDELINIKDVFYDYDYIYKRVDDFEKIDIMRDYDWYIY